MKDTVRTFVAIKIKPEQKLLKLISRLKNALETETIKWVEPSNLHLTLRFLGETKPEQVEEIGKLLENICHKFQPFQFTLKDVGYFKKGNHPKVLFLTIEDDSILKQLANEINKELSVLGFEGDSRNFKPHLTLARIKFVKIKNAFYSFINGLGEAEIQTVKVYEIIFYQSILSSAGPEYKALKIIKLK